MCVCVTLESSIHSLDKEYNGSTREVCEVSERYLWSSLMDRLSQHQIALMSVYPWFQPWVSPVKTESVEKAGHLNVGEQQVI